MQESISEKRLGGCALGGSLAVTSFIRDGITIIHSPQGCAHQMFSAYHAMAADSDTFSIPKVIVSNITNREVIFGGEEALLEALDRADAENPALISVVTSCVPETIGDDVEGVCASHAAADKIVYVPASGFLGGSSQDGENIALISISKRVSPSEIVPRTAVIIGEKNLESEVEENYAEVCRLLSRLGISVSLRFCRNISAADIIKLGTADFFIIRDERVEEAGRTIAENFGRPYVSSFPSGLSGCVRFIREAGLACGISEAEIEDAVSAEEAYQAEQLSIFKELSGMKVSLGFEPFAGCHAVAREAMQRLNIHEAADGMEIKLPFYLPVGLSGVLKMLYLWRREKRK
ncbi:MAG TPA: nitrogenase component 1 [Methanocorpusculum sp.]|nr:nitrogenase component 1 [Methanocorpusculum sp.]